ncbi:unnamed protein product [Orchesella dallaii]|uniref:Uncharacterized protein n=1 Tax=Orchesella dallaii TaxID=48710 RepID=A0ABP1RGJ7_9HEXA
MANWHLQSNVNLTSLMVHDTETKQQHLHDVDSDFSPTGWTFMWSTISSVCVIIVLMIIIITGRCYMFKASKKVSVVAVPSNQGDWDGGKCIKKIPLIIPMKDLQLGGNFSRAKRSTSIVILSHLPGGITFYPSWASRRDCIQIGRIRPINATGQSWKNRKYQTDQCYWAILEGDIVDGNGKEGQPKTFNKTIGNPKTIGLPSSIDRSDTSYLDAMSSGRPRWMELHPSTWDVRLRSSGTLTLPRLSSSIDRSDPFYLDAISSRRPRWIERNSSREMT